VVKQAMDVAAIQAKIKNIELIGRLAPVHYQVEADADLIYQATLNLLSNAIKYTPEGCSVRVGMAVDEGLGTIACTVADTGVGIPADELPYVFDKFYRGRANRLVGKGTGLGLTLTKRIIEDMHYGSISVTSEEGKGSTFAFELPISTTAPGRSLSSSEAAREEAAK
jgi:signal transduction histidine kinase